MKKKLLSTFLAATMVFVLVGCGNSKQGGNIKSTEKTEKVVRIGFPGTQNFIGGVAGVAQEKKYIENELEKVGYKVEYKPFAAAGPAVNEALTAKEIDIAIYADFPGILSKSKGVETSLIGIADNYITSAIIAKSDSPISSVKDLKGKKIGFAKGTYMQKYLYQILDANGIAQSDVELINTTDFDSALQGGSIDALVVTDTQEAIQVLSKKIAKTIDSSKNHPDITAQSVIVGNSQFLSENKDAAVALFKALKEAKNLMKENTNEAYEILTKSGLDKEATKTLYGKDNEKFDYVSFKVDDEAKKKIDESKKFMIDNKLISKDFDTDKWMDNSFYEEANK
ncbi:ABC transporter substrate-binding protein [Clostridium beijerinckii]|uniref:Sulfonate transport system substrate-binding protein n=1 Tax=Clostridium beijerinckii TaxID=1520 RepID=A0A9Q5D0Q3_CLOBE|nr:ABC transporter substrate-binding protein [Clostridium beijerinckii]AQS06014.1 putative aliphatic sulfonates-binding protein precursor [Clostridium beijerinckii]MBA2888379.1 sulfonate transport system substrate-binding protein [Clostridium beijerinckii]MBA2903147.1 sulfonate transport system substrate-binding protein [Clostridium beijerinckii]MBA2912972.1 sulfonate transport system substrate-binding protein [Clostridium beijerinckii]MBA9014381.1 sulfonate transport system substrate-binding 